MSYLEYDLFIFQKSESELERELRPKLHLADYLIEVFGAICLHQVSVGIRRCYFGFAVIHGSDVEPETDASFRDGITPADTEVWPDCVDFHICVGRTVFV